MNHIDIYRESKQKIVETDNEGVSKHKEVLNDILKMTILMVMDNDIERLGKKLLELSQDREYHMNGYQPLTYHHQRAYNKGIEDEINHLKEQRELISNEK